LEDRCLKRVKVASGISVFITEELGDARLRCNQLKDYINEATSLIEKSDQRDHFFEVAGHLLHGIPDTLMRMDKALSAAAMAMAKWDYEEIKEDLRPEKAEQLEDALKDVRVRRVKRKSSEPEASMKIQEAAEQLNQIVASIDETGQVDTGTISRLIASLEGDAVRSASSNTEVADVLRTLADGLAETENRPSRLTLAATLRRVLADTMEVKADAAMDLDAPYNMAQGFEYIRNSALVAYRRGSTGHQMRQAFDQLAGLVSEIGLMCDSVGASDVAGLAIRMSKAIRLARRLLKPDVLDGMMLASDATATDEKESRFEEGKPADPTENMSEEDAKQWKIEHDKNKDQFKSAQEEDEETVEAGTKAKSLVPKVRPKKYSADEKESRFEEGKPADPTENMSDADASKWKTEHDKNKDQFKSASPAEVRKLTNKMNDGLGEKQTYSLLEESLDAGKITSAEFRRLESEAEEFFDPDYKTASESSESWKA
jgi:hypothetical protein